MDEEYSQAITIRTPTPVSSPSPVSAMTPPTLHPHPTTPLTHLTPHHSSRAVQSYPCISTSHPTTFFGSSVSPASATTAPTSIDPSPILPAPSADCNDWTDLSSATIDSYDLSTLRQKLTLANSLIKHLTASLSSIRTTAAHYCLQHKLLLLETSEAAARHQVESDITRREVEVLKQDQEASSWNSQTTTTLTEENELYKRRLRKAKRSLREYKEELGDIKDENERLKKRIRENRLHQLEASKSPVAVSNPTAPTPPRPIRQSGLCNGVVDREDRIIATAETEDEGDRLAALGYLASQVLSQGSMMEGSNATRETTPRKHRPPTLQPHHQPPAPQRELLSPVAFTGLGSNRHKRRRSRDSTISASDGDRDSPPATMQPNPNHHRGYAPMYVPQVSRTLLPPISPKRQYGSLNGGGTLEETPRKRLKRTPQRKGPPGTPVSPPRNGFVRERVRGRSPVR